MNWGRWLLVVAISAVISSMTDWLFMGVLFHRKYLEAPEVWRTGMSQRAKIGWSELIGAVACAGFAYLLAGAGQANLARSLPLALVVWVTAVVPILATFVLWMKLSPWIGVSHSLGWFVRLAVTAATASVLL